MEQKLISPLTGLRELFGPSYTGRCPAQNYNAPDGAERVVRFLLSGTVPRLKLSRP